MKYALELLPATATESDSVDADAIDACTALAWVELVTLDTSTLKGDDWLALCDDIDSGEIYRCWFLWRDREVSGNWEAYDPLSDRRFVAKGKVFLKAAIDSIENARNQVCCCPWALSENSEGAKAQQQTSIQYSKTK